MSAAWVDEPGAAILTPEHVPIRLVPAGLGTRFWAMAVDTILVLAGMAAVNLFLLLLPGSVSTGAKTVIFFLLKWGYDIYFETRHQGRTPGKRLCGLRVVDARGLPITFQQSFVRNIARALDFAPVFYGAGALAVLIDRRGRRIGDLIADTLVIQDLRVERPPGRVALERRFNSLREPRVLRRIRRKVGLEEREFLGSLALRADRLDPKARFDLMERVGAHYRGALGIEDPGLSGENLVQGLLSILYGGESTAG